MSRIMFFAIAFLCSAWSLAADLTPEQQQTLARSLAEKVQRSEIWIDEAGHVTGLILINHQALTKSVGEKPGIDDEDLLQISQFPKLTALNLEAQPVTDKGLAVLKQMSQLKQIGFHYMGKARAIFAADRMLPPVSGDFVMVIDGMQDLEIIEIKHNFKVDAINVDRLTGPFPKVWRLVIDTPITAEQSMHLIELCPNVIDLQLHRTNLEPDQVRTIGQLLPKLEVLWFKPRGGLKAEHLSALSEYSNLKIYSPQHFDNPLPFEGAWDVLTRLPKLKRLEIESRGAEANRDALKMLQNACPSLVISSELTRSRNYNGL